MLQQKQITNNNFFSIARQGQIYFIYKGRTQCRELPLYAGSEEGCQWQALPSPVQCEETATQTRDLPVTGGKTLPLAPGPPFTNLFYLCQHKS